MPPARHAPVLGAESLPQGRRAFRPEVQALRAVAVAGVVLYHLWPRSLPGGFVGVDVFFVISGFLITQQLVEEIARTGRVSLAQSPPPGLRFQRKDTEQYHLCLGAPGISRADRRRFAASLLDSILGGSASSRLFQEIREKRGMAYAVYSFASQYTDTGLIGVYVGTREENLAPCVEICVEQIADIAAGNLRAGELERAKESLKGRVMLSMESTSNRMSRLGKSLVTDTELLSVEEVIAAIERVTVEDVSALAADLLGLERLSAAGIGPSEERFRAAVERVNPRLLARAA